MDGMTIYRVPDFTPRRENELPADDLDSWSEANWARVPENVRRDVEQHLSRMVYVNAPELLAKWRD